MKQLDWEKITSDKIELLNQALYTFKEIGDLEQALVNWNSLPELDKTTAKAKEHFKKEYAEFRNRSNTEAR